MFEDKGDEPSIATAAWADPDYYAQKFSYRDGSFWLGRVPGNERNTIGYSGDRHIFLCGETRSGKGRAFILNNLITWPGSLISIDPKGENATVAAARRGPGNEFCEGMEQDTFVLDPFEVANVDDELRGFFDPMLALDPDDPRLIDKARMIAAAICVPKDGAGDANVWIERGQGYLSSIIMHVVTSPVFGSQPRTLSLVRECVLAGMHEEAKLLAADPDCQNVSGIEIMLNDMVENPGCGGVISRQGASYLSSYNKNPEYFDSIKTNAENETAFLDSPSIRNVVGGEGGQNRRWNRTFEAASVKTSPQGVSVFLCLPQGEEEVYSRWQRLMIYSLTDAIVSTRGKPARGDILISLDEFLSLSKMKRLEDGMEALAGAGGKLFIAVQKFGRLKAIYGQNWETFISGAGCQIWFAADEVEGSSQYLEKALGKTEIIRISSNEGTSESTTHTRTKSTATGETHTSGTADQTGSSQTVNQSTSKQRGWSKNWQNGQSIQWGSQRGSSEGTSKEPWFIFAPLRSGSQSGTNRSTSSGGGSNTSRGGGTSGSRTDTYGRSDSQNTSHTVNQSTAHSHTTTDSDAFAEGETATRGRSETFHTKPLLTVNEANKLLAKQDDIEDMRYPGFALIRIAGEDPFVVRKCYYDQDIAFTRLYTPHPDHEFIPNDRRLLLPFEDTDDLYYELRSDDRKLLEKYGYQIALTENVYNSVGLEYWPGDPLPTLMTLIEPDQRVTKLLSPSHGLIADITDTKTSVSVTIRQRQPLNEVRRKELNDTFFGGRVTQILRQINDQEKEEDELRNRKEAEQRERTERENKKKQEIRRRIEESRRIESKTKRSWLVSSIVTTALIVLFFLNLYGVTNDLIRFKASSDVNRLIVEESEMLAKHEDREGMLQRLDYIAHCNIFLFEKFVQSQDFKLHLVRPFPEREALQDSLVNSFSNQVYPMDGTDQSCDEILGLLGRQNIHYEVANIEIKNRDRRIGLMAHVGFRDSLSQQLSFSRNLVLFLCLAAIAATLTLLKRRKRNQLHAINNKRRNLQNELDAKL